MYLVFAHRTVLFALLIYLQVSVEIHKKKLTHKREMYVQDFENKINNINLSLSLSLYEKVHLYDTPTNHLHAKP